MSKTITTEVSGEMLTYLLFLAEHFLDDIKHAQMSPYDYSDEERDNCDAAWKWASNLLKEMGLPCSGASLGEPHNYTQADEICEENGWEKEPWIPGKGLTYIPEAVA